MATEYRDIEIDQGSDFIWNITIYQSDGTTPQDLTDVTIASDIRRHYSDTTPTASFSITYPDAINGQVRLSLSDTTTSTMLGRYIYI